MSDLIDDTSNQSTTQQKRVAFLTSHRGVEESELTEPWRAVEQAGAQPELISTQAGEVELVQHKTPSGRQPVERVLADVSVDDYDALVLPGGTVNGDTLRQDQQALDFVKAFAGSGKPVAAICHAGWVLADSGVAQGRKVTSWPDLEGDLSSAGADWVDEEVVTDGNLITSRKPDDIPAFNNALLESLAHGVAGTT